MLHVPVEHKQELAYATTLHLLAVAEIVLVLRMSYDTAILNIVVRVRNSQPSARLKCQTILIDSKVTTFKPRVILLSSSNGKMKLISTDRHTLHISKLTFT